MLFVLLVLSKLGLASPFAYITNFSSGNVSAIDTGTNAIVATIPGPLGCLNLGNRVVDQIDIPSERSAGYFKQNPVSKIYALRQIDDGFKSKPLTAIDRDALVRSGSGKKQAGVGPAAVNCHLAARISRPWARLQEGMASGQASDRDLAAPLRRPRRRRSSRSLRVHGRMDDMYIDHGANGGSAASAAPPASA